MGTGTVGTRGRVIRGNKILREERAIGSCTRHFPMSSFAGTPMTISNNFRLSLINVKPITGVKLLLHKALTFQCVSNVVCTNVTDALTSVKT